MVSERAGGPHRLAQIGPHYTRAHDQVRGRVEIKRVHDFVLAQQSTLECFDRERAGVVDINCERPCTACVPDAEGD